MPAPAAVTASVQDRMDAVREQLRQRRRAMEMTQEDVASQVGINVTTIKRIEQGASVPAAYMLMLIARALDYEVVLTEPHVARLLALSVRDISDILRAASMAAHDGLVLPVPLAERTKAALEKLNTRSEV